MPWSSALVLQHGEKIVAPWYANYEVTQTTMVNGSQQTFSAKGDGVLVLTNYRFVFLQQRGSFAKSYHVHFDIPLGAVRGLSLDGLMSKWVSMSLPTGEGVLYLAGVSNEAEFSSFNNLVQNQIRSLQMAMEAERRKERVQIVLDFVSLRDYMSKGGLSIQVVKCPECGAPLSLPRQGSQVKCNHCGSLIFAQDIMEKVKELIG